jgi:hypothetical protein
MIALLIPFALVSALLVKKPTVNGTIGKIQGKKNAATPAKRPNPKVTQSETGFATPALAIVASFFTVSAGATPALATLSSAEPTVVNTTSSADAEVSAVLLVSACKVMANVAAGLAIKKIPKISSSNLIVFILCFRAVKLINLFIIDGEPKQWGYLHCIGITFFSENRYLFDWDA